MNILFRDRFFIRVQWSWSLFRFISLIMDEDRRKLFCAVPKSFFLPRYACFDDESSKVPFFLVESENGFLGGGVVGLVKDQNGELIGKIRYAPKFLDATLKTHQIENPSGEAVADIKTAGMNNIIRCNYYFGEKMIGYWQLESVSSPDYILCLGGDADHKLDRRLALAAALLLRRHHGYENRSTRTV